MSVSIKRRVERLEQISNAKSEPLEILIGFQGTKEDGKPDGPPEYFMLDGGQLQPVTTEEAQGGGSQAKTQNKTITCSE